MSELMKLSNVYKKFGKDWVVKDCSLTIQSNRIIGILGKNGMGKSTLLKLMAGLLKADDGLISDSHIKISYLLQPHDFYSWMKVKDAVEYYCDFYMDFDKEKAMKLLQESSLEEKQLIRKLSTGQGERLCLILALSRRVDLYLLDEPISGVDAGFKREFKRLLLENIPEDATVLIVTNLLKDMETIFDEIVLMTRKGMICLETDYIRAEHKSVEEYYMEVVEDETYA